MRDSSATARSNTQDASRFCSASAAWTIPLRSRLSDSARSFPPAIHEIVKELSAINIERFPNATLDLLRTFLEKTIKAYAEILNEDIKKRSNDQGFVYLSNCLIWLEEHFKSTGQNAFLQPLQKIRSERYGFVGSKSHLDATNHNHHVVAVPDDVRDCWITIEGVLKAVLKP